MLRDPVVSEDATFTGIVTVDDLLDIAAEQLHEIIAAIRHERAREVRVRR